jgi:hypothetical protein
MKMCRIIILLLLLLSAGYNGYAQTKQHQVAIFVPLYLDSAFDATDTYRYGKTFPRQSISGLEFYIGAALTHYQKKAGILKYIFLISRAMLPVLLPWRPALSWIPSTSS